MRRAPLLAGLAAALLAFPAAAVPASAATNYSFAVIGDVPYGSTQLAKLPSLISQLNAASNVQLVAHLGDITGPPINCTDSYNATIRTQFNRSVAPFVYTPGDNEWADCSRASTGAANPLSRLTAVRSTFFPVPGRTLGVTPMAVTAQSGYPENVTFDKGGISISTLHLVGSYNDLAVWNGQSGVTSAQQAEEAARDAADSRLIASTFARAEQNGSRAVVFLTQADMFISTGTSQYKAAFGSVVRALASGARAYGKPVLLLNGDTHVYRQDKPLTSSAWLNYYGAGASVPNLTRITVQAGTTEWLRVTVVSTSGVLQTQRVRFQ